MTKLLERNVKFITSPRGIAAFIATTLILLATIRASLFPGVGGDDGEQLIFAQAFSWGYQIRNPPLVTWLLIGVQAGLGPTVASIVLLRGLVLGCIFLLIYLITDQLCRDRRLAALATGSLLLIFYVGWKAIHGFTHTITVTAFYLLALYLTLRIWEAPSRPLLIALGLTLGLGLLAKYIFLLFAIALILAALTIPSLRGRIISPWLLIGFAISLPLVIPQGQWLLAHVPENHLVRGESDLSLLENLRRTGSGIFRLLTGVIGFLLPLWLFITVIFWPALRRPPTLNEPAAERIRLFSRLYTVLVTLAVITIIVVQSDRLRSHYMFVLVPLVPLIFSRYGPAFQAEQIRRYAAVISTAGVVLIGSLVGKFFIEPLVCDHCEDHIPYDDFARQLREAGFKGGTIFAYFQYDPLAGNLKSKFPGSRVVSAKHPDVIAPQKHPSGQCLVIWPLVGVPEPNTATIRTGNESPLNLGISQSTPWRQLTSTLLPYRDRKHKLGYVLLENGAGECR